MMIRNPPISRCFIFEVDEVDLMSTCAALRRNGNQIPQHQTNLNLTTTCVSSGPLSWLPLSLFILWPVSTKKSADNILSMQVLVQVF